HHTSSPRPLPTRRSSDLLHQAALDSIEVSESEVIQRVDYMTNMYIANIGSREKMEEYFNKTSSQIRETLRENAREGLKVQKMQQDRKSTRLNSSHVSISY